MKDVSGVIIDHNGVTRVTWSVRGMRFVNTFTHVRVYACMSECVCVCIFVVVVIFVLYVHVYVYEYISMYVRT